MNCAAYAILIAVYCSNGVDEQRLATVVRIWATLFGPVRTPSFRPACLLVIPRAVTPITIRAIICQARGIPPTCGRADLSAVARRTRHVPPEFISGGNDVSAAFHD